MTAADRRRARDAARAGSPTRTAACRPSVDQRHERQEHHHPADHPHPACGPAATSARRPPTASSSTSGSSSRATGPGRAARGQVLGRSDIDVAVLETARGGILLRGVGYESNDASVLTNVSSDHLDLQGIHTLPELAEVKAVIARITRPTAGSCSTPTTRWWPPVARRVRARGRVLHRLAARRRVRRVVRRHLRARRPGLVVRRRLASSRSTATGDAGSWRSARCRPRSSGWPATTSPTRWRRPPARAPWARRSSRSPTACATSGRPPSRRPGGSTCSAWARGSSSSTSPTTRPA